MTDPEILPEFPVYDPPKGLPVADPKQGKPLMKLMKFMLKPPKSRKMFSTKPKRSRKKDRITFY